MTKNAFIYIVLCLIILISFISSIFLLDKSKWVANLRFINQHPTIISAVREVYEAKHKQTDDDLLTKIRSEDKLEELVRETVKEVNTKSDLVNTPKKD